MSQWLQRRLRAALCVIAGGVNLTHMGAGATASAATVRSVENRQLADSADGRNWLAFGRTFDETHFSPLRQITDRNLNRLSLAAFTDLPPSSSVVTTPLAVDGVLYVAAGLSVVYAIDSKNGRTLWRFDPHVAAVAGQKLRGAWGVRGLAYWGTKVYVATQDGRLIAIDAGTGKPVWSVATTEKDDDRYITGAPRVFNGKVVIGHGGGDFAPVRGYVTAYDAETGRQLWRFYTVPGDPARGFESEAMRMAAKTWSGQWWTFGGGGAVWNSMTYDPLFNRLYLGTGNGIPWNQKIRSPEGGDNLFLSSIVALNADTGEYVWHYQLNPGDTWDFDAAMDMELADLTIDGRTRHVILQAAKNGFFYVIDRTTGALVSAEKFGRVNWATRIDQATGRPVETPEARFRDGAFLMFPASAGAHGLEAMSFNPIAGLVFIPVREAGRVYSDAGVNREAWRIEPGMVNNTGLGRPPAGMSAPSPTSSLVAWDPVKQQRVWSVPTSGITGGATLSTAGNLVFQGQVDGRFLAYAADSGKELWRFDAQVGVLAQPISYQVDHQQYVSVVAGFGGVNAAVSGSEFGWQYATQKRRVLTFTLSGRARLPRATVLPLQPVVDQTFPIDAKLAAAGAAIYGKHCLLCHGIGLRSGGAAPDLRMSTLPLSGEAFAHVVHDGALVEQGMPRFDDLSAQEVQSLQHYIRSVAQSATAGGVTGSK